MKILLMGPPACGKGTQGDLLSVFLKLPLIKVGNILRSITPDDPRYIVVNEAMDKGDLVPLEIVAAILKERVLQPDCDNGYIIDGWDRQMGDLRAFDPPFDKVLFFNISTDTSIKRITARRVCEKEGHNYNLVSMLPKKPGVCDIDGSNLIIRDDDKEDVVIERLRIYKQQTLPVVDYFRSAGLLIEIDAEPLPQEIFEATKKLLGY